MRYTGIDSTLIVFVALVASVALLFPVGRALHRYYLMLRVRQSWFPDGRFILLTGTDDGAWREYITGVILPQAGGQVVYDGYPESGYGAALAGSLIRAFAHGSETPAAIVFKPNYQFELLDFFEPLSVVEQTDYPLRKTTQRLFALADAQKDEMRLYI